MKRSGKPPRKRRQAGFIIGNLLIAMGYLLGYALIAASAFQQGDRHCVPYAILVLAALIHTGMAGLVMMRLMRKQRQ